jgi:hypothetical protein
MAVEEAVAAVMVVDVAEVEAVADMAAVVVSIPFLSSSSCSTFLWTPQLMVFVLKDDGDANAFFSLQDSLEVTLRHFAIRGGNASLSDCCLRTCLSRVY